MKLRSPEFVCRFFKKATKTHRALDELRKLHEAMVQELWAEYERSKPSEINHANFTNWALTNEDATTRFVGECVIDYAGAIIGFVDAVRTNDSVGLRAARAQFMPVWFGRNHPIYQELVVADELTRMRSPAEVSEMIAKIEAVTRCLKRKHEGTKFITSQAHHNIHLLTFFYF